MRSVFLLFFTFLCIPLLADKTDDLVRNQMASRRIPGIALTVISNGVSIKTACYGFANVELKVPVSEDTVFEIGSITKQFTAAAILLLAQEGKLTLDDKLNQHLHGKPDKWDEITLKHLLSHTSGVKSYTGLDGFELRQHLTQRQFIEKLTELPLEFRPGTAWKYSNSGFNLLGYVIENVTGTNYWAFMQTRFFKPLRMALTRSRDAQAIIEYRASGYEQTNHVWINRDSDLTDIFSAGAICSTILDMTRWNDSLDRATILNEQSKSQMWTSVTLSNGKPANYGYGWFIEKTGGQPNIGHGGSTSGFSCSIQRFPDARLAVILLSNTDEQIATSLAREIGLAQLNPP